MEELGYSIGKAAELAEVSERTLRDWIRRGLVPPPLGRGRAARYLDGHVLRARAVQSLRAKGLSLAAIPRRLAKLSEDELRAFAPAVRRPEAKDGVPQPPPEPTYPARAWEVVQLAHGLVLMVNPQVNPARRLADEIYRYYGVPAQAGGELAR